MNAWRILASDAQGFPCMLQHACGAVLEVVAPHTWQVMYAGRSAERTARQWPPRAWAEAWLAPILGMNLSG